MLRILQTIIEVLRTSSSIHKFYLGVLVLTMVLVELTRIKAKSLGMEENMIPLLFLLFIGAGCKWAINFIVKDRDNQII